LYYQHEGTARLYTSEWKIVTYLNLQGASDNIDATGKYIGFTVPFWMKHSGLWQPHPSGCNNMLNTVKREYAMVKEMRGLILQLTRR
jgi:hypothetical protein